MTLFPELTVKLSLVGVATMVAVTEVINELTDSANKVGTLGMQGLLALMLLAIGWVTFYLEKKRTADREQRDRMLLEQYNNLLAHHESFARTAEAERGKFHLDLQADAKELRGLTERSIVAMHAMATATDALREYLRDHQSIHDHETIGERRRLK